MAPAASISKTLVKLRRGGPIIPPVPVRWVPQTPSSSFSSAASTISSVTEPPSASSSQQPQELKMVEVVTFLCLELSLSALALGRSSEDKKSVQSPVLVNRGWVPRNWKDKSLKVSQDDGLPSSMEPTSVQESTKSSWWRFWSKKPDIIKDELTDVTPVEVVGVVRGSEKPSIFVPANDPSSFQWFYVNVPAIARACGLPEKTIYLEDINENFNPSNPYPVPKDPNTLICSSVMPQDHLNYTLTWYSLSAAVTFMAFKRLKPKKSRR